MIKLTLAICLVAFFASSQGQSCSAFNRASICSYFWSVVPFCSVNPYVLCSVQKVAYPASPCFFCPATTVYCSAAKRRRYAAQQNHTLTREEEEHFTQMAMDELKPFEYFRHGKDIMAEEAAIEEAVAGGMTFKEAHTAVAKRNVEQNPNCVNDPNSSFCNFKTNKFKPVDIAKYIDLSNKAVCYFVVLDPCITNKAQTKFFICGNVQQAREDFIAGIATCGDGGQYSVKCSEEVPGIGFDVENSC